MSPMSDASATAHQDIRTAESPTIRTVLRTNFARAENGYAVVTVYFGTDREVTGSQQPATWYGRERGPLSFGTCEVSIPMTHRLGELESPSWPRLFPPNPQEHVVL